MLYNNVTFLCEGLFDNLINLYVPWVNTRLSSEYTKFERLPLKSREISVVEILGLICAIYKVISQFYIAHTYCATTVHIKERGFFLYGRIFRKSKSSFFLTNKCGDQKCLFSLGIKEIPFLDKKYKPIFNVGKIKKILASVWSDLTWSDLTMERSNRIPKIRISWLSIKNCYSLTSFKTSFSYVKTVSFHTLRKLEIKKQ